MCQISVLSTGPLNLIRLMIAVSTGKSFDFRIIGKLVLETIPNLYYSTQYFIDLCYRIVKFIVGKESIIVTPHPCAEEVWGKMVILINIKFRS